MFLQGFGRKISRLGAEATNLLRESFQGMPMDLWEEFTQERKCLPQLLNISDHFRTKGLKFLDGIFISTYNPAENSPAFKSNTPLMVFFIFGRLLHQWKEATTYFPR